MFKLYKRSQQAQLNWIREHPVAYITLNVVGIVAVIGYIEYKDRQWTREFEKNYVPPQTND